MSLLVVVLVALKAFAIVMFAMNLAVMLTWADRRQGAMIQDRVGPNRAVIWLPTRLAQAMALLPAMGAAALVLLFVFLFDAEGAVRIQRALVFSQVAILVIWLTGLFIAGRVRVRGPQNSFDRFLESLGDPRRFFYVGLGAHALAFAAAVGLRGSVEGQVLEDVLYGAGPFLLVFGILLGAGYAAFSIRNEPRVGLRLAGLLHPAADGLKTLFKEDFIPPRADKFMHGLAPFISFFPALVVLGVVPFGDTLCFGLVGKNGQARNLESVSDLLQLIQHVPRDGVCTEGALSLQVVDINVGLLYFFALAGTGIVGAALAGWSSDNKYSLLGGLRAASQMISYEVTLGLTVIGALMVYGTIRVDEMIRWQTQNAWGIFVQPAAFFLFFAASVAESKRIPFDIPEGESELVAGYFTEYAGMKFAMFFFAEYIAVVASSALMAALFFGGWHLPFLFRDGLHVAFGERVLLDLQLTHGLVVLAGLLGFIGKVIILCWLQLTIRWTLPRFRYDQLMQLGWRKLLPASLLNILATGVVVLALRSAGPYVQRLLALLGELSMAAIAIAGAGAVIYCVLFFLRPAKKDTYLISSSSRFAAAAGGTSSARMGA